MTTDRTFIPLNICGGNSHISNKHLATERNWMQLNVDHAYLARIQLKLGFCESLKLIICDFDVED